MKKKDLCHLLGLSPEQSNQNYVLKFTTQIDPSLQGESILEQQHLNSEGDRFADQWAVHFIKKNQYKTEKQGRRLRSAFANKGKQILQRAGVLAKGEEENLQGMFLKSQDVFDLQQAVKLIPGVAAEKFIQSKDIHDNNEDRILVGNTQQNYSTQKFKKQKIQIDNQFIHNQTENTIQKDNFEYSLGENEMKNEKKTYFKFQQLQNLEIKNNLHTEQSIISNKQSNKDYPTNNHIFEEAYKVFGQQKIKYEKQADLNKIQTHFNQLEKKQLENKDKLRSASSLQFPEKKENKFEINESKQFRKKYFQKRQETMLNKFKLFDQINPLHTDSYQDSAYFSGRIEEQTLNASQLSTTKLGSTQDVIKPTMKYYQKKAQAFNEVCKKKLRELRIMPDNLIGTQRSLGDSQATGDQDYSQDQDLKMTELNVYQADYKLNKLISNKIRVLNRIQKYNHQENGVFSFSVCRKLRHRDGQIQLDPIRCLILRTIPINRVIKDQARAGPELCFVNAVRYAIRNDFSFAISELHKGLSMNPNNFHCRFTHGVLMFKLGLISQAKQDFQIASQLYPKELIAHFNYGLVLLELQDFQSALVVLKKITDKQVIMKDLELLEDANLLQAQCYWRIREPVEAGNCFKAAQRIKAKINRQSVKKTEKVEDLQSELRKWELRQMKNDIQSDQLKALQGISKTPRIQSTYDLVQRYRTNVQQEMLQAYQINLFNSELQSSNKTQEPNKGILKNSLNYDSKDNYNQKQPMDRFQTKNNKKQSVPKLVIQGLQNNIKLNNFNQQAIDIVKIFEENIRSYTCRGNHDDFQLQNLRNKKQVSDFKNNTPGRSFIKSLTQKSPQKIKEKKMSDSPVIKDITQRTSNSVAKMKEKMKNFIQNQLNQKDKVSQKQFNENEIKNILGDNLIKKIDNNLKGRFSKIFNQIVKQEQSKRISENNGSTVDEMKLKQTDLENTDNIPISSKETETKDKCLQGIDFNPNGIVEINQDQEILEELMDEFKDKLRNVAQVINSEIDQDDSKIFNKSLKNIDLNEYRQNIFDTNRKSKDNSLLSKAIDK